MKRKKVARLFNTRLVSQEAASSQQADKDKNTEAQEEQPHR